MIGKRNKKRKLEKERKKKAAPKRVLFVVLFDDAQSRCVCSQKNERIHV